MNIAAPSPRYTRTISDAARMDAHSHWQLRMVEAMLLSTQRVCPQVCR